MKIRVFVAVLFVVCLGAVCVAHSEQKAEKGGSKINDKDKISTQKDVTDMRPDELPYKPIMKITQKEWEALVSHAQKTGTSNEEANIYLWGYLYRLHSWFYINLGDGILPYAGVVDGRPSLMLFTDPDIAAEFIKVNKIKERKEAVGVVGFILPSALNIIQSYEKHGIQWVRFNMGRNGSFGEPINLLQAGYKWHMKNDPRFKKTSGEVNN